MVIRDIRNALASHFSGVEDFNEAEDILSITPIDATQTHYTFDIELKRREDLEYFVWWVRINRGTPLSQVALSDPSGTFMQLTGAGEWGGKLRLTFNPPPNATEALLAQILEACRLLAVNIRKEEAPTE